MAMAPDEFSAHLEGRKARGTAYEPGFGPFPGLHASKVPVGTRLMFTQDVHYDVWVKVGRTANGWVFEKRPDVAI
jgi:hypothetical protein